MSLLAAPMKRVGARALNVATHVRTSPPTFSSSITTLPSTGAGAKLSTAPILCRTLSNSAQQKTYVDEHEPESRHAMNPERREYSQSGTDNDAAAQNSAWDIKNRTPEQALEESERESATNGKGKTSPLEVSPANQEVSRSTDESGRGASVVHGPSKRVSPKKGKKVDYGGGAPAELGSGQEANKM